MTFDRFSADVGPIGSKPGFGGNALYIYIYIYIYPKGFALCRRPPLQDWQDLQDRQDWQDCLCVLLVAGLLACWLVGLLACWLAGWLAGLLADVLYDNGLQYVHRFVALWGIIFVWTIARDCVL